MANLIIKPTSGGLLKLQEDGGTDAISIGTDGKSTITELHSSSKFPAGHVIQTQGATGNTKYTFSSDSWAELHTENRVTITPTSTSNKLFFNFWAFGSGGATDALYGFRLYDVTGSSVVEPKGVTGHSGHGQAHFVDRGSHYDANECHVYTFGLWANIARTTATVYTIQGNAPGGSTAAIYFNHTNNTTAAWAGTGTTSFVVQEIQQ